MFGLVKDLCEVMERLYAGQGHEEKWVLETLFDLGVENSMGRHGLGCRETERNSCLLQGEVKEE